MARKTATSLLVGLIPADRRLLAASAGLVALLHLAVCAVAIKLLSREPQLV